MNSLLAKMRIKAPHRILPVNAPADFGQTLGKLPAGIELSSGKSAGVNSIHWFVKTSEAVNKETAAVLKLMEKHNAVVWCYFPKGTSKIQTDLTRDKGWDALMKIDFKWLSLISFNDTWSAFSFRLKTDRERVTPVTTPPRLVEAYADPKTKTVRIPDDLEKAFVKSRKAREAFNKLAYSHRREYVEWIITAKRDETRLNRIAGTLEKLLAGKKNPAEK